MFECLMVKDDSVATLIFDYDEGFIAELKQAVPSHDRGWNPEKKEWTVSARHVEDVLAMAVDYFGRETYKVVTDDDAGKTVRTNMVTGHKQSQGHLFSGA